jgi:hypothetical protein
MVYSGWGGSFVCWGGWFGSIVDIKVWIFRMELEVCANGSGIGATEEVEKLGIETKVDLPGVGKHLVIPRNCTRIPLPFFPPFPFSLSITSSYMV